MPDVRQLLERGVADYRPAPDALQLTLRRVRRRQLRRRSLAAFLAFVLTGASIWALTRAFLGSEPAAPAVQPRVTATIPTFPPAGDVEVAFGRVWVVTVKGLYGIDAATGEVALVGDQELDPDFDKVAAGHDGLWVSHGNQVTLVDPEDGRRIRSVSMGSTVTDVVVAGGYVWGTRARDGRGDLLRVTEDAAEAEPTQGPPPCVCVEMGEGPAGAVAGGGFVWVSNLSGERYVSKVDPDRAEVVGNVGLPGPVAFGFRWLWAVGDDGLHRVDPGTLESVETIPIEDAVDVAVGDDAVWVLTDTGSTDPTLYIPDPSRPSTVVRVDPSTDPPTISDPVPVGLMPMSFTAAAAAAWVTEYETGRVYRVGTAPV